MALTKMGDFTFDHADQADTPALTPAQLKAGWDSRGEQLKTVINDLIDALEAVTDSASGADQIGMTAITETGAAATVQAVIEALITRLKAVANSASGADLIGATVITETGEAATAQTILEALAGKFNDSTGHGHTGTGSDSPKITSSGIDDTVVSKDNFNAKLLRKSGLYLDTTINWGTFADGAIASGSYTIIGAEVGDYALTSLKTDKTGIISFGKVTASNTITVYIQNISGSTLSSGSATIQCMVIKQTGL